MDEHNLRQFLRQLEAAQLILGQGRVNWMRSEVGLLFGESLRNWDLVDDVLLCTVLDTDVAESEWYLLVHKHLLRVDTTVHNIDLCDDTDCANTLLVDVLGHLQSFSASHISIGWDNSDDDRAWV